MKKTLLIGALALMAGAQANAVVDGFTYAPVGDIKCENKWVDDRTSNMAGWNALPFASMYAKARTACLYEAPATSKYAAGTKVIVGFSQTIDGDDVAHLVVINIANGAVEDMVQMTCNGEAVTGLLCANQVGCDNFNNLWFAGYVATTYNTETNKATPLNIYKVDDLATGTCTKVAALEVPEDESAYGGRIDYCDAIGDITRENARSVVMAAVAGRNVVYGWQCEQGESEWEGHMDGYVAGEFTDTYPADQADWGTAPACTIIRDEEYTGDLFYVDGFTTCPTLYDVSSANIGSFAEASDLAPKVGTNGVSEFKLADKDFIVYSMAQYDVDPGCQIRVAELGEGQSFTGMKSYWLLPENGLGTVSDGGTRTHSINVKMLPDEAGKEGLYLMTYKCNNGLGVYAIYEDGWNDPLSAGVNDIISDDVTAPVEYFNLQGVAVSADNLTPGLYITRQGKTVAKKVVK